MPLRRPSRLAPALALPLLLAATAPGQDEAAKPDQPPAAERPTRPDDIKPRPRPAIPDDPPPHEGAMIDFPTVIEPPDLILVEVLEAQPGRPITGERLVRPDGTITLGFYGTVHVRGLTPDQAKEKIVLHLKPFLSDEILGLRVPKAEEGPAPAKAKAEEEKAREADEASEEDDDPPAPATRKERRRALRAERRAESRREAPAAKVEAEAPEVRQESVDEEAGEDFEWVDVAPVDSDRVFVDIVAYNSTVYYVLGDVHSPGRLPTTGKDTVLDALQYAGGLTSTADPAAITLVRPASGAGGPKVYKVDYAAIVERGETRTNYQLFPGDRIVVGRNALAKAVAGLDRPTALYRTATANVEAYARALKSLGEVAPNLPREQLESVIRDWTSFWLEAGSAPIDDRAFREALLRRLSPERPVDVPKP